MIVPDWLAYSKRVSESEIQNGELISMNTFFASLVGAPCCQLLIPIPISRLLVVLHALDGKEKGKGKGKAKGKAKGKGHERTTQRCMHCRGAMLGKDEKSKDTTMDHAPTNNNQPTNQTIKRDKREREMS